jgi:hypothetical protein
VGRERVDAELGGEGEQAGLGRPDPLAADLDDLPVAVERLVQRAPADAVSRLEHDDRRAGGPGVPGRGEAREPGADDRDVDVRRHQPQKRL